MEPAHRFGWKRGCCPDLGPQSGSLIYIGQKSAVVSRVFEATPDLSDENCLTVKPTTRPSDFSDPD